MSRLGAGRTNKKGAFKMPVQAIYDVVDKLSDERRTVIYRLALDMLSAQQTEDFDYFSEEDISAINGARREIARGEGLSFGSIEELKAHFGGDTLTCRGRTCPSRGDLALR